MVKVTVSAIRLYCHKDLADGGQKNVISDHGEDWGLAAVEAACQVDTWAGLKR